jgi:HAMP domain-containing protein
MESVSPGTQGPSAASTASSSNADSREGKKVRRAIWPILDRQFQVKVTLFILLLILLSHLFLLILHYRNFNQTAQGTIGKSPAQVQMHLEKQRRVWARDLFLGILVISVAVGMSVFYLTQKVSGPLFAIARVLDDFSKGDTKARVTLRHNDELLWFGQKVNETLDSVKK